MLAYWWIWRGFCNWPKIKPHIRFSPCQLMSCHTRKCHISIWLEDKFWVKIRRINTLGWQKSNKMNWRLELYNLYFKGPKSTFKSIIYKFVQFHWIHFFREIRICCWQAYPVDSDSQGIEWLFGALYAHMWRGMILKSGDAINEPSLPEKEREF